MTILRHLISRVLVRFAGTVVLAAAALKYHLGLTDPGPVVGFTHFDAIAVALIGVELFFGLWAVVGVYSRALRIAGGGLFALFFFASVAAIVEGSGSCSCFGRITIPPAAMAVFDAFMVFALWYFPHPTRSVLWTAKQQPIVIAILLATTTAAVMPLALHRRVFETCSLVFDAERLDFGLIEVGGRAELVVRVTNTAARTINITSFNTSCSCLDVQPGRIEITPQTTRAVVFVYDGTKQPGASGRYRISFAGRDAAGDLVCTGQVAVELVQNPD